LPADAAGPAPAHPITLTDATLAAALVDAGSRPVLVDMWAPWCGPCRMIAPVMDQLAAESGGRYVVGKINIDDNPRTATQFQVDGIPTMLLFKNGKLVDKIVGLQPKQALAARLAAHA
jgi:thioredoxin